MWTSRRIRIGVLIVAVLLVSVQILLALDHFLVCHSIEQRADAIREEADAFWQDVTPEDRVAYEAAREWLENNGFEVIKWDAKDERGWIGIGKGTSHGTEERFFVVEGTRVMTGKGLIYRCDLQADISFRYHLNGARDVTLVTSPCK
jgi:hypothetical protein